MLNPCLVCKVQSAKYKCPTCRLPFCSVPCSKQHREKPCEAPPAFSAPPVRIIDESRKRLQEKEEKLPDNIRLLKTEHLQCLDSSKEVQRKVKDERLMAILQRIDSSANRVKQLEKEMKHPAFLEFCDDVLEALGFKSPPEQQLTFEEMMKSNQEIFASREK